MTRTLGKGLREVARSCLIWWTLALLAAILVGVLVAQIDDSGLRKPVAALLSFAIAGVIAVLWRGRRLKHRWDT
jgi:undecaprenyl pyrophosphate phosphatase UppP